MVVYMCQCQQYNYLMCCHGNVSVLSLVLFCLLLSNMCSCHHYKTYVDLHVKCLVFLSDFKQIWIFLAYFHKSLHIRFHENLSGGSRALTCGQMDRWTDMTILIGSFHENTYKPKKLHSFFS